MTEYFKKYVSNTLGASGTQAFAISDGNLHTAKIYYKIFAGGNYGYSFLFSNAVDGTVPDGVLSVRSNAGYIIDEWEMRSLKVAKTSSCDPNEDAVFSAVLFDGKESVTVPAGGMIYSDEIRIDAEKGDYLCLEITFRGKTLPCHFEAMIPAYSETDGKWVENKFVPFPSMVGCGRKVAKRILFWGDSITQGIGVPCDSYKHYAAVAAEILGEKYSYWDIGVGYGRAADAFSRGAWFYKAKQSDIAVVCFGVNDMGLPESAETLAEKILGAVKNLKENGVKVILQTVPPFDYRGETVAKWEKVNEIIKLRGKDEADAVFDCAAILGEKDKPYAAEFGGHPNEAGAKLWGEKLAPVLGALAEERGL